MSITTFYALVGSELFLVNEGGVTYKLDMSGDKMPALRAMEAEDRKKECRRLFRAANLTVISEEKFMEKLIQARQLPLLIA